MLLLHQGELGEPLVLHDNLVFSGSTGALVVLVVAAVHLVGVVVAQEALGHARRRVRGGRGAEGRGAYALVLELVLVVLALAVEGRAGTELGVARAQLGRVVLEAVGHPGVRRPGTAASGGLALGRPPSLLLVSQGLPVLGIFATITEV